MSLIRFVLVVAFALSGPIARAQEMDARSADAASRPGRYHLGPFYLTPRVHVGTIGLDTNVFYTPTDRRTDLSADGGPGLAVVLPFRRKLSLTLDGSVGYVYFVRTESQRRLTGEAGTTLEWTGARTELHLEGASGRTFSRPSPDVDRRVQQDVQRASVRLRRRLFGRTGLRVSGGAARYDVDDGQEFLGTDLSHTLSREETTAEAALEYALTAKTGLVLQGTGRAFKHHTATARDAEQMVAAAGVQTSSKVLLEGRILLGATSLRPKSTLRWHTRFFADADITWHVTPRTRLGGSYARDSSYTAFTVAAGPATAGRESITARLEKDLHRNVDFWLLGRRTRLLTDGAVRLRLASGTTVESVRDDVARELTMNLGYRFRRSFRLGAQATYSERRSSIADLGVEGLLLGGTITFDP